VKASGINPAGSITTISFTTDPVITPPTTTPSTPTPVVEHITVEVKEGNSDNTVSQITIVRTTNEDGKKTDTVSYDQDKAVETIGRLKGEGKDTARIVIPDANDQVLETIVNILSGSLEALTNGDINLQIDTEEAKIDIAKESLKSVNDDFNQDLFFNLVPIKEVEHKAAVNERAVLEVGVINGNSNFSISVLGNPITIETNMPSAKVDITLPLNGFSIPTDARERDAFLRQLAVYIEHSDGEKELVQGEIVVYKTGVLGIRFQITKFSNFAIVKTNAFMKSSENRVINITVPTGAIIKGTNISATVDNKVTSITLKAKVSDKASWKLFSDVDCTKELVNQIVTLKPGQNKAYLKVTSENGTIKIYTVLITRSKSTGAEIIKVTVPKKATLRENNITATVEKDTDTITLNVSTSKNATWKLYSDKNCSKELTNRRMKLKEGINTAYLKVTTEDIKLSNVYTIKITREKMPIVKYNTYVKLGLIGSKTYTDKVAKIFERDYDCKNVIVKKEGRYYRVYIDFTSKTAANAACKDMKVRNYIINYYFYTK
jgi:hypothetical protein